MAEAVGGDVAVLTDSGALLDRADVDAVIVATPHFNHAELGRACVAAGKPVLIEKPVVCTVAEFRELRALSNAAGGPRHCRPDAPLRARSGVVA